MKWVAIESPGPIIISVYSVGRLNRAKVACVRNGSKKEKERKKNTERKVLHE